MNWKYFMLLALLFPVSSEASALDDLEKLYKQKKQETDNAINQLKLIEDFYNQCTDKYAIPKKGLFSKGYKQCIPLTEQFIEANIPNFRYKKEYRWKTLHVYQTQSYLFEVNTLIAENEAERDRAQNDFSKETSAAAVSIFDYIIADISKRYEDRIELAKQRMELEKEIRRRQSQPQVHVTVETPVEREPKAPSLPKHTQCHTFANTLNCTTW